MHLDGTVVHNQHNEQVCLFRMQKKKQKGELMLYLNKLLQCIKKYPDLFTLKNACNITGLINSQILLLRKFAIENGLICVSDKAKNYILTEMGEKYLKKNPVKKNSDELDTNLEYLKLEKTPPFVTRAIRQLSKHIIEGENINENSLENYIKREILEENNHFIKIMAAIENYILSANTENKMLKLNEIYNKFANSKLTKSVISVMLLYILDKNKDKITVYESGEFHLKLTPLIFDRMLCLPDKFEIKILKTPDNKYLKTLCTEIIPDKAPNLINLTSAVIKTIKSLEKYTLSTRRLTKKVLKIRNLIINSKDALKLFLNDIPAVLSEKDITDEKLAKNFLIALNELKNGYKTLLSELQDFMFENFNETSFANLEKRFENVKEFLNSSEFRILYNTLKSSSKSDDLKKIEKIATFINGKLVPKDWTDDNIADFKLKIANLAAKFKIIEASAGISEMPDAKTEKLINQIKKLTENQKLLILQSIV